jgi:FG-GAP-like repeat
MVKAGGRFMFARCSLWSGRWRALNVVVAATVVTVMVGTAPAGAIPIHPGGGNPGAMVTKGSVAVSPSSVASGQPTTVSWSLEPGAACSSMAEQVMYQDALTQGVVKTGLTGASGSASYTPQSSGAFFLDAYIQCERNNHITTSHRSFGPASVTVIKPLADGTFYFHALGTRCWDFGGQAFWGAGAPVFLYTCNGTVAQQVRVKELDATHDVEFRVQSLFCIGVRGGKVGIGQALELQTCNGSPGQRFAYDGDAILLGAQQAGGVTRDFVIEPLNEATPNRTPLVVGSRDASDAEYFRMKAIDGSSTYPTTGFVHIGNEEALDGALGLGWGTVIEIDDRQPLELKGGFTKQLHAGVTLRGYRKHTDNGAEIVYTGTAQEAAFGVNQDNVRVTGLRLRQQPPHSQPEVSAISVDSAQRVLIDHLEISHWTGSAVGVGGTDAGLVECPNPPLQFPRKTPVRIMGNFIHNNGAYGVVAGNGAFVLAQGNILYLHGHSIASDPWATTGYVAYDNFVLSQYSGSHDFDAHGSDHPGHWYGGRSGDYYDIGWNTFLTRHLNFEQRGTQCRFTAFHNNVTLQSESNSVATQTTIPVRHVVYDNTFSAPNPTSDLAVGDFDGDGIDDVFVGTGAGWYFSSGGQAEWRFLNRMLEHAKDLRFGDFDGDGRIDVLALHGRNLDVSWAGISPWQTINTVSRALSNVAMSDLAIGDFNGDHNADIFLATGKEWLYAPGGKNWLHFADSGYRTSDLRFGDFTGDGKTDVFGVVSNQWQIVRGGGDTWEPLRNALMPSVAGLVVADFDGDGFADVVNGTHCCSWRYSRRGRANWETLRAFAASEPLERQPVGRFDGNISADILLWNGDGHFDYAPAARDPVRPLSRQVMR